MTSMDQQPKPKYIKIIDYTEGRFGQPDANPRFGLLIYGASKQAYAVFDELGLQGGGYTWAAILESLVRATFPGSSTDANKPQPEMQVPWQGETLSVDVDAEGDTLSARCSSRELLEAILEKLVEADADPQRLRDLIAAADDNFLE